MRTWFALTAALLLTIPTFADATPDGAVIYKKSCAMCHGPDGKGRTAVGKSMKVRDLTSPEVQKLSDDALYTVIADGKGKMPGYKSSLSDAQIKALVVTLRDLARK
jgi:cytochrome c6